MTNSKKQAMFEKMREFVDEARDKDVRFKTYNIATEEKSTKHAGKIVVAYTKPFLDIRTGHTVVGLGIAFCSPKDEFTRLQGRGIAAARLLHSKRPWVIPVLKSQKLNDILPLAIWAVAHQKGVTWMRGKNLGDFR
jgi:hypothetical protein